MIMYGLRIDKAVLLAEISAYAMGDRSVSTSRLDRDSACNLLKKLIDYKWNWTEAQKEYYKCLVELCKHL